MKRITIDTEKIRGAYKSASAEQQKVLRELFGELMELSKPTLDDYTTIRTYEDACEALGVEPLPEGNIEIVQNGYKLGVIPPHIIALMKLETISRALWGKDWKPEPDAEGSEWFYYPVFALYTQQKIEYMDEDKRGGLLSATAHHGASAGFGCLDTDYRSSSAYALDGFCLCQEDSEKAKYFGKQFLELWAEYLKFGFEVGGRMQ